MKSGKDTRSLNEMLNELNRNRYANPEETILSGLASYACCKQENYELGMAFSLMVVGQACVDSSKYEEAINYLFDCIQISQKLNVCDLQVLSYINIGNIYFDLGNYEISMDFYHSAERLTRVLQHSKNYYQNVRMELFAAKIINNKGEIFRAIGCYEDAKKYYIDANRLEEQLNYEANFGMTYSNLGNVEYHLGNYEKALDYLNEAISWLLHYDYKIGLIEAYGMLALVYEQTGNYKECERYFLKAIESSIKVNYAYVIIDNLINYSCFLEHVGKMDLAIMNLEEGYQLSIDKKMYTKTMEICKITSEIYEKRNDKEHAYQYYHLYFEYQKKIEPVKAENRAKNLRTKIERDSLEDEHKSIQAKSEDFRRKAEDLAEIIKSISIIGELGQKITTTLELESIYEMLNDTIKSFMKVSYFGVGLYNDEVRRIQYHYRKENDVRLQNKEINFENEASMAVKCLQKNRIIVINDMFNAYLNYIDDVNYVAEKKNSDDLNSAIFCPLIIDQNLIGVMTVQAYEKNAFTMVVVEMIKALSFYAAIAINNAIKSKSLLLEVEERRKFQIQLEETNNKLIYLSENDALTNIPNRRKFDLVLNEEWRKAVEQEKSLALIIFDIDYFKQYNDSFGHYEGDRCLNIISDEIRKSLTRDYFAARYGGDEFVVILPDAELEEALNYGEDLRKRVENLSLLHRYSKVSDVVTITLGASAIRPLFSTDMMDLIRQADMNLYAAKRKGKNQIIGKQAFVVVPED